MPAKRRTIEDIAKTVAGYGLRHIDRAIYEMAEGVTDRLIPQGADELARALFTGHAFTPHANHLEPTDLPQHGDPGVWGARIFPNEQEVTTGGDSPNAGPQDGSNGPDIGPPDNPQLGGPGDAPRIGPPLPPLIEAPTIDHEGPPPMPESLGETLGRLAVEGRDDLVHQLENPLEGVSAPDPQPEPEPEPEPEPDLEPDW